MEKIHEGRTYKSYFFEKNDLVEDSIRSEFSYVLTLGLVNIDLRPRYRAATIAYIAAYISITSMVFPLLAYTTYLLRHDLNNFTSSLHYSLLMFLGMSLVIQLNLCPNYLYEAHYSHFAKFYKYENEEDSEEIQTLRKIIAREKRAMLFMPVFLLIIGASILTGFIIDEYLLDNIKHKYINGVNMKLIIPMYTPYESHEGLAYFATTLLILVAVIFTVVPIGAVVYLYSVGMQRLVLQLQILRSKIRDIEGRSLTYFNRFFPLANCDMKSRDFTVCLEHSMKQNMAHYNVIKRYFFVCSSILKNILLMAFLVGSTIIGLSMLLLSKGTLTLGNQISMGMMSLAEVLNMLLLCAFGQRAVNESQGLLSDLYTLQWFNYNYHVRHQIIGFKILIQKPLMVKAGGFLDVELKMFTTIMNASFSFFNFLKASGSN